MTSNALTTTSQNQSQLQPSGPRTDFQEKMQIAKVLLDSGLLPKALDTMPKVLAVMMMCDELHIGYWQGFIGLPMINGKPSPDGQLMLALINRSGQLKDLKIEVTEQYAKVTMERVGRSPHTETVTLADAKAFMTIEWSNGSRRQIPLTEKANWKSQPKTMLKWSCVKACARVVFSDVISGMFPLLPTDDGAIFDEPEPVYAFDKPKTTEPPPRVDIDDNGDEVVIYGPERPPHVDENGEIHRDDPTAAWQGTWYAEEKARSNFWHWLDTGKLSIEHVAELTGKQPWEFATGKEACEAIVEARKPAQPRNGSGEPPAPADSTAQADDGLNVEVHLAREVVVNPIYGSAFQYTAVCDKEVNIPVVGSDLYKVAGFTEAMILRWKNNKKSGPFPEPVEIHATRDDNGNFKLLKVVAPPAVLADQQARNVPTPNPETAADLAAIDF